MWLFYSEMSFTKTYENCKHNELLNAKNENKQQQAKDQKEETKKCINHVIVENVRIGEVVNI